VTSKVFSFIRISYVPRVLYVASLSFLLCGSSGSRKKKDSFELSAALFVMQDRGQYKYTSYLGCLPLSV
jgi:hypothetical protein